MIRYGNTKNFFFGCLHLCSDLIALYFYMIR